MTGRCSRSLFTWTSAPPLINALPPLRRVARVLRRDAHLLGARELPASRDKSAFVHDPYDMATSRARTKLRTPTRAGPRRCVAAAFQRTAILPPSTLACARDAGGTGDEAAVHSFPDSPTAPAGPAAGFRDGAQLADASVRGAPSPPSYSDAGPKRRCARALARECWIAVFALTRSTSHHRDSRASPFEPDWNQEAAFGCCSTWTCRGCRIREGTPLTFWRGGRDAGKKDSRCGFSPRVRVPGTAQRVSGRF